MPALPPLTLWACVAVLVALAARSAARLALDRVAVRAAPGRHVGTAAEITHLAMALGMAAMLLPTAPPGRAALWFFLGIGGLAAADCARGALRRLGRPGRATDGHRGHVLESHHVLVALAMAGTSWHAAASAAGGAMGPMSGMRDQASALGAGHLPGPLAAVCLGYVWLSLLPIGWGLARAIGPAPHPHVIGTAGCAGPGIGTAAAALAAPAMIYACEAAMTVVMGLMLLM